LIAQSDSGRLLKIGQYPGKI